MLLLFVANSSEKSVVPLCKRPRDDRLYLLGILFFRETVVFITVTVMMVAIVVLFVELLDFVLVVVFVYK